MTLLENIYYHLQHNGLVNSREHFSTHYLGKSKNWYAVQTYEGRDFSLAAAIQCLRQLRRTQQNAELKSEGQHIALRATKQLLEQHLTETHFIAEVL